MENRFSVIPEVFYDFISRVPAGAVFLVGLGFVFACQGLALADFVCRCDSTAAGVLLPLLALITSYVTGFLLSSLASLLFRHSQIPRQCKDDFTKLVGDQGPEPHFFEDDDAKDTDRLRIKLDVFLKHRDRQIAMEMAKHNAEAGLFRSLTASFLILTLLSTIAACVHCSPRWVAGPCVNGWPCSALLFILAAAISFLLAREREGRNWKYYINFCGALFRLPNK